MTTDDGPSRGGSPRVAPAPLLRAARAAAATSSTPTRRCAATVRRPRGRHRTGRHRRRAGLGLPLLLARLPDPAAPRGRRHPPGRPDRASTLAPLQEALAGTEWILHAATQDLPCLAELGLVPAALFDTELAGRLLGYPRVGLATLVETLLGRRLAKEHSAVDWSTRPLPRAVAGVRRPRRRGAGRAARRCSAAELVEAGKDDWAAAGVRRAARLRADPPGRRRGGVRRGCTGSAAAARSGAVRALWEARDEIAPRARRDARPDPARLGDRRGRHRDAGRPARRCCAPRASTAAAPRATPRSGSAALSEVAALPEEELPTPRTPRRRPARCPVPGPRRTRSPPAG